MKVYALIEKDMTPYSDTPDFNRGVFSSYEKAEAEKQKLEKEFKDSNSSAEICSNCPVNTVESPSIEEITEYCRKNNKTPNIDLYKEQMYCNNEQSTRYELLEWDIVEWEVQ